MRTRTECKIYSIIKRHYHIFCDFVNLKVNVNRTQNELL